MEMTGNQKVSIFFYSGTGNSYFVAKKITESLKNVNLVSITTMHEKNLDICSNMVGIVFPINGKGIPPVVYDFLVNSNFEGTKYLFVVMTYGGIYGRALEMIKEIFRYKNISIDYLRKLLMPANCVISYQVHQPSKWKLSVINRKVQSLCDDILVRKRNNLSIYKQKINIKEVEDIIYNKKVKYANRGSHFYVNKECVKCFKCVNICPVANVCFVQGTIIFSDRCIQCMACINWCPCNAINWKKKTENRNRYTYPCISYDEMLINNKDVNYSLSHKDVKK